MFGIREATTLFLEDLIFNYGLNGLSNVQDSSDSLQVRRNTHWKIYLLFEVENHVHFIIEMVRQSLSFLAQLMAQSV